MSGLTLLRTLELPLPSFSSFHQSEYLLSSFTSCKSSRTTSNNNKSHPFMYQSSQTSLASNSMNNNCVGGNTTNSSNNNATTSTNNTSTSSTNNNQQQQQQQSKNAGVNAKKHQCQKCKEAFPCPLTLRIHSHEHCLPNVQQFSKKINNNCNRLLHISYQCSLCNKSSFSSRDALLQHCTKTHLRNHPCDSSQCRQLYGSTSLSSSSSSAESCQLLKAFLSSGCKSSSSAASGLGQSNEAEQYELIVEKNNDGAAVDDNINRCLNKTVSAASGASVGRKRRKVTSSKTPPAPVVNLVSSSDDDMSREFALGQRDTTSLANSSSDKCKLCNKSFSSKRFCDEHFRLHHFQEGNLSCSNNNNNNNNNSFFNNNNLSCSSLDPDNKSSLESRKKRRKYDCAECQKSMATKQELMEHRKHLHSSSSPLISNVDSGQKVDRKRQGGRSKGGKKKEHYQCSTCQKILSSKKSLEKHVTTHEKADQQPFKCDICGRSYSAKKTYVRHLRTHANKKSSGRKVQNSSSDQVPVKMEGNDAGGGSCEMQGFRCKLCGKIFQRREWRTEHYLSHGGDTCFRCEFCGEIFPDEQFYLIHAQEHFSKEVKKAFLDCAVCGKRFPGRELYERHSCRFGVNN